MKIRRYSPSTALAALLALAMPCADAGAGTFKVLHTFAGGTTDGANPMGNLVADAAGNLYGTTGYGGANGDGTIYRLSPPIGGQTRWTETILYSFGSIARDGEGPVAGLLIDQNGALDGTTEGGGSAQYGTVFRLTPPTTGQTRWTETILYNFDLDRREGRSPEAPLTMDAHGRLYGTTNQGGLHGSGTVFMLTPPVGTGEWTETFLYQFPNGYTVGNLVVDASGIVYGLQGVNSVFKLVPPAAGKQYYKFSLIGAACATTGGNTGLTANGTGGFYVLCSNGVSTLTPPTSGTAWIRSTLYTFGAAPPDGSTPNDAPMLAADGALYYTTRIGGAYGYGAAFELKRPKSNNGSWTETRLGSGTSESHGAYPIGGVIVDAKGDVFGTMAYGGNLPAINPKTLNLQGNGTVYEITP